MRNYYIVFASLTLLINGACETKKTPFYIKAANPEELKINAFEICGRNYSVLSYEEDTALVKCLRKN